MGMIAVCCDGAFYPIKRCLSRLGPFAETQDSTQNAALDR